MPGVILFIHTFLASSTGIAALTTIFIPQISSDVLSFFHCTCLVWRWFDLETCSLIIVCLWPTSLPLDFTLFLLPPHYTHTHTHTPFHLNWMLLVNGVYSTRMHTHCLYVHWLKYSCPYFFKYFFLPLSSTDCLPWPGYHNKVSRCIDHCASSSGEVLIL